MSTIGQSPVRPDGWAKVTGQARFADDESVADLWFGSTVRSRHARARIETITLDERRAPPEAVLVTAADLPGPNAVLLIDDDWPILAGRDVNHWGEPVALVAAPSRSDALEARDAVTVDVSPLKPVLEFEDAEKSGRLLASLELVAGDADTVLREAQTVVEGHYSTGHQEHIYIECQAVTARFDAQGRLEVSGTMQCPYYVHRSLCHAFGLGDNEVRVRATAVGGGFGGKEDYPSMIAIHAALLARASGRPVRLAYDRQDDIIGTTKRHPARIRHRTAVDTDGRLLAMDIDVVLDGGAYTTLSPVVLSRAVLHAAGPYRCPNVRVRGKAVRTNTATNGAFRGFGAPQAQFAMERQMDRIARHLDLDPLEIRLRNAVRAGDRLPTGQRLDESTSAVECLERVAADTDFSRRWRAAEDAGRGSVDDGLARGVGISLFFHGAGFTGNGERKMRSPVEARVRQDGRIEVCTSMVDMGQGCCGIYLQMAGDAGGLSDGDIALADPDTSQVPDSGPTVASRATMVIGHCVIEAVVRIRDRVLEWWRQHRGIRETLSVEGGVVTDADGQEWPFRDLASAYFREVGPLEETVRYEPPAWQDFDEESYQGAAYSAYSWGANVVEVEVDRDTLSIHPTRVDTVCEVGRVIHETQCRGQIEGGTLQAVGWALLEEMKLEEGRYLNDRLATYMIPTFKDSPRIEVTMIEKPCEVGPFGAKGVGELPMDGPAAAAVGAVENAVGVELDRIPVTPEALLAAIRRGGGGA